MPSNVGMVKHMFLVASRAVRQTRLVVGAIWRRELSVVVQSKGATQQLRKRPEGVCLPGRVPNRTVLTAGAAQKESPRFSFFFHHCRSARATFWA